MDAPSDAPAQGEAFRTATLAFTVAGQKMQLEVQVPTGRVTAAMLLPIARTLMEAFVGRAIDLVEAVDRKVSCKAGCGACCRQLVPVTFGEARAIHALVAAMPPERQAVLRERFARIRARVEASGLLPEVYLAPAALPRPQRDIALDYFRLYEACPFLEDESCSIHPDRPLSCRQYLVTSPAEWCRVVDTHGVVPVPVMSRVDHAAMLADPEDVETGQPFVPLSFALEWVETHPEPEPDQTGPQLLQHFLQQLFRRVLPKPGEPGLAQATMVDVAREAPVKPGTP